MKLYWRVKIDGKWTYKAATVAHINPDWTDIVCVYKEVEE